MNSRDQNQIQSDWQLMLCEPKRFPQQTLQPHPAHGVSVTFRDAQSKPGCPQLIDRSKYQQVPIAGSLIQLIDTGEISIQLNTLRF